MDMRKKITYGILLPVLAATVLTAGAGIGEAQARYVTVAGWHTQIYAPANAVNSNILAEGGQTVLLGETDPATDCSMDVWFASTGGNTTGRLVCEPVENGEYVTAVFPSQLTLVDGVRQTFTLTLRPTVLAQTARQETITVKLRLYWQPNPQLSATLELVLLPTEGTYQNAVVSDAAKSNKLDLTSYLTFMENYAPGSLLPVSCRIPEGCTAWRLGLLDGEAMEKAFPAMTRYSLDGGDHYYMLGRQSHIALPVNTETVNVLLDFSRVDVSDIIYNGLINLCVSADADSWTGTSMCSVNAELTLPGHSENTAVAVVTRQQPLQLSIPRLWDGTVLEYTIQRQGKASEKPMPAVTVGDGVLTVSAEDGQPKPGTYVMTLSWKYGDVEVASRRIVLFVNYAAYADAVNPAARILAEGGMRHE